MAIRMKLLKPMRGAQRDGTPVDLPAGAVCEVLRYYPKKPHYPTMERWSQPHYDMVHKSTGAYLWAFKDEVQEMYEVQDWAADFSEDMAKAAFMFVSIVWAVFAIYMWGNQIKEGLGPWLTYLQW